MLISTLINLINKKLADELLSQTQLLMHMDSVIDDINAQLNTVFPTFTEVIIANSDGQNIAPAIDLDYQAIPDKYLRSVVVVGAANKYYEVDEEGNETAPLFAQDYRQQLFYMLRDYSMSVPAKYRAVEPQGMVRMDSPSLQINSNLPFEI